MPALFIFLLKVNAALLLFCGGYYFVLRHLTFYTLNRFYLVTAILFASVYPEIHLSTFLNRHQQIVRPVQQIIYWQTPDALVKTFAYAGYWQFAQVVFWAVAIVLALRLLVQLYSVLKIYKASKPSQIYDHSVRLISDNAGPFSFWKNIYVNPANHSQADLKAILMHEQIHVNELHTADILLAELSTIFYWFNPGVWLIKKAIRENIEFITDRKILNNGIEPKQYQYSLVNVSFAAEQNSIVNNFNISTIKKRIIMMNAKKSSKFSLTRYAFLVPAVIALLLIFSISKAAYIKKSTTILHRLGTIKITSIQPLKSQVSATASSARKNSKLAKITPISSSYKPFNQVDTAKDTLVKVNIKSQPVTYILNGKIVDNNDLKNINPGDIKAITVLKPKGDGKPYIYVTTKNSADVEPLHNITVTGYKGTLTMNTDTVKDSTRLKIIHGHIIADTGYVKHLQVTKFRATGKFHPVSSVTYDSPFANSFSLSRLSDKLVIIDGKIASETDLKKLSAFYIDKMVLKTDAETKELYGERAKNGILFIVTKKAR